MTHRQIESELADFRPQARIGWLRRVFSWIVLLLLASIIGGYWFITDSTRVRHLAQDYLSELIGGRVEIHKAHLSIFEGLRLEGVRVYVDDSMRPDSCIFTARELIITASAKTLTSGRLQSSMIVAIQPRVRLCEDLDTGQWNYQRIKRPERDRLRPRERSEPPVTFPQVLLREGVVEYSRLSHGEHDVIGRLAIDGQLLPLPGRPDEYKLDLDSRLPGQLDGPRLRGTLDMARQSVWAQVDNVQFGQSVAAMLPSQVQKWWQKHQLAGRIRISEFHYVPKHDKQPEDFRVVLDAEQVGLTLWPEELMDERQYQVQKLWRPGIATDLPTPFPMVAMTDSLARVMEPRPVRLQNVAGRITFTPDGILLSSVRADFEGNRILVTGQMDGYSEHAPLHVILTVPRLSIPHLPSYVWSMPREVRKIWAEFRPFGNARLTVEAQRTRPNARIDVEALLDIENGSFTYDDFPYPLRKVTGQVWFGRDRTTDLEKVEFRNLICHGTAGTENANTVLRLSGWVSPVGKHVGVDLHFSSEQVVLDPMLREALPHDVKDIVSMFDVKQGKTVRPAWVSGGFDAHLTRERGPGRRLNVDVNLDVRKGFGAFEGFPYPLRNLSGRVEIHPFYVDLKNIVERKGDATLKLDGRVSWGNNQPVTPDLVVTARGAMIDQDLLESMPQEQADWLRRLGLQGQLNIDGRIYLDRAPGDWILAMGQETNVVAPTEVGFDLDIHLADGSMRVVDQPEAITQLSAEARLTRSRLTLSKVRGKCGEGDVTANGVVQWPDDQPSFSMNVDAAGLRTGESFYRMMPEAARQACRSLDPEGTLDVLVNYRGGIESAAPGGAGAYTVTVHPRGLSLRPRAFPWRLEGLEGEMVITPEAVTLKDVSARHGQTSLRVNGGGSTEHGWTFSGNAERLSVNEELTKSLPEAMRGLLKSIDLKGEASLDVKRLFYLPAGAKSEANVEFDGAATLAGASMDVGVPVSAFNGTLSLQGKMTGDQVTALTGEIDAPSAVVVDRPMQAIRCGIRKLKGEPSYRFDNLRGKIAGGDLGAQVIVGFPRKKPAQFEVSAVLKDVDVRQLVGDEDAKFRGRLQASLDMRGSADDPGSRYGGGNIELDGKDLYELPALTGLLQITNLALPITSPFNNASARYAVRGQKVIFEKIALNAPDMVMQGSGELDYGRKTVKLSFTTENPNWIKVPGLDSFLRMMKKEFVTIEVRGTIKEPEVQAKSMSTVSTTVDEVFKSPSKR